jgi:hypothetical protein
MSRLLDEKVVDGKKNAPRGRERATCVIRRVLVGLRHERS